MQVCSLEQITVGTDQNRQYFPCLIIVNKEQAREVSQHCAVCARIRGPQALQYVEVKRKKEKFFAAKPEMTDESDQFTTHCVRIMN